VFVALGTLNRYAPKRAMSKHRTSIPLNDTFTPPPAIELGRARPVEPTAPPSLEEADVAAIPASPPAPKDALKTAIRKRMAILLAVLAVPAMAAPGDFGAIAGDAPSDPEDSATIAYDEDVMAFEQPGMSFPGSAFYYLADPPNAALVALPESDPLERAAVGGSEVGSLIDAGPAARGFIAGTGVNYLRAQDCLAQAIWYEAASESAAGQRAVAQVVLNRVAHPSWPSSVCGVVYEGSQRSTGCQFSFTCDGSLKRRSPGSLRGTKWSAAQRIAAQALNGSVYAPIGHATHYHTLWVDPYWAKTLDPVGVIGAHRFYRNRGRIGDKDAFTNAYAGAEPNVSSRASGSLNVRMSDSAGAISSADAASAAALSDNALAPNPISSAKDEDLADQAHSTAGQARKEYARAGQWKVDPATLNIGKDAAQTQAEPETSAQTEPESQPETP